MIHQRGARLPALGDLRAACVAGTADLDLAAAAALTAKEAARRTLDEIDDLQQSDREKAAVAAATVSSPAPA